MEISIVLNVIVIVLLVVLVIVEWFAYRSNKSDLKAVWQGIQFEQKYIFEQLLFLKSSLRVLLSVMVIVAALLAVVGLNALDNVKKSISEDVKAKTKPEIDSILAYKPTIDSLKTYKPLADSLRAYKKALMKVTMDFSRWNMEMGTRVRQWDMTLRNAGKLVDSLETKRKSLQKSQ